MSNYKEGLDSILQAINNLITPQLVSLKYDKTFRGKITSIIDNGLYEVQVNGRSYTLPYAGTLQVGDIVKVKSPLNNFSDIYIEAIGGSGGGSTTTDYNDLTSKPILNTNYTSSLSPDASEIIKGTIGLHKISKTGKYSDLIGAPDLDFIPNSEKGVAGGVATLDENSKLPTSQLPDGIVTDPNYVHTDNNFTNALLTKLNGIESGAQANKIESISKNGEALTITNKNVNIEVPTKLSELENDNNTVTDKDYVHTDNNFTNALLTKLNGIESGAEVNAISGIKVNEVLQPIVNKIVSITVPTKTSDLTNDSGFIDKDVDNLTNYYKKTETYSQSETNTLLDNKADKSSIPTKLSQLDNDTGFITNAVDNLTNYYLKSETYTKTEVNDLIGQIKTISIQVVDTLPTTGESNIIYLVPKEGSKDDVYNEYIWVNNAWELIGSTQIDLTGYATEDWVNTQIANFLTESQITQLINNSLANYYTQEQVNNLLDNKADKSSIPTKTSDLTNDSGYITKSVDNLDNYYTETEINSLLGNKANTSDIPTKTSQLTNDSGYIDNTVNDLENYYKKSETYNQTQVNNLLNNKADKTEIPTKVSELENDKGYISEIPIASSTQLGGIKVGNNLSIEADGTLNASKGGVKSYNDLTDKPVLNTNVSTSQPVSEGETITGEIVLHKISKTGSYNDLLDKPTIPEPSNEVEISQTQPTDTGVELWVDLSENPSGGGQKTYKYKMSGSPMKEISPGGTITLPCNYKVDANVLDVYFNGELLVLSSDAAGSNGHYLEVGDTDSISNEIQLTSDWGTGTDYYLAIVVRGEYASPTITFTVGTTQYQAEKGMTFNEYTSSSYNVDGFYVYGADNYVYTGDGKTFYPPSGTNLVVGSDTIISGGNYTLNEG